jgi:hypothetical protein
MAQLGLAHAQETMRRAVRELKNAVRDANTWLKTTRPPEWRNVVDSAGVPVDVALVDDRHGGAATRMMSTWWPPLFWMLDQCVKDVCEAHARVAVAERAKDDATGVSKAVAARRERRLVGVANLLIKLQDELQQSDCEVDVAVAVFKERRTWRRLDC